MQAIKCKHSNLHPSLFLPGYETHHDLNQESPSTTDMCIISSPFTNQNITTSSNSPLHKTYLSLAYPSAAVQFFDPQTVASDDEPEGH